MTFQKRLINHNRSPYFVRCYSCKYKGKYVCIIQLVPKFYRVIYAPTGVTLTDTDSMVAAKKFTTLIKHMLKNEKGFMELIDSVNLNDFPTELLSSRPVTGEAKKLATALYRPTIAPGHVSADITKNCRYKYKPEYVI